MISIFRQIQYNGDWRKEVNWMDELPLHLLAQRNVSDEAVYRAAFDAGFKSDAVNEKGFTPLDEAIRHGSVEAATFLWNHYASLKLKPQGLHTPFSGAYDQPTNDYEFELYEDGRESSEEGDDDENNFILRPSNNWLFLAIRSGNAAMIDFVRQKLQQFPSFKWPRHFPTPVNGAPYKSPSPVRMPSLLCAMHVYEVEIKPANFNDVITSLLRFDNIDVNERDANGRSALHLVCSNDHPSSIPILQSLLGDARTDFGATDGDGRTALHHAAKAGFAHAIQMLLCFDRQCPWPAHVVAEHVNKLNLANLMSEETPEGITVDRAFRIDHNACDHSGQTAFSLAIRHFPSFMSITTQILPRVRTFNLSPEGVATFTWQDGVPTKLGGFFSRSPIPKMRLSGAQTVMSIELLTQFGCNLNARSYGGKSLLHKATSLPNFFHSSAIDSIIKCLLGLGVLPNATDRRGLTPLHQTLDSCHAQMLLDSGGDANHRDKHGRTALHNACGRKVDFKLLNTLVLEGGDVDAADDSGFTPLHCAAAACSPDKIALLMEKGANPNATTHWGKTALHFALSKHQGEQPDASRKRRVVEVLIKGGCDPSLKDHKGFNALHTAALSDDLSSVRYLMRDVVENEGHYETSENVSLCDFTHMNALVLEALTQAANKNSAAAKFVLRMAETNKKDKNQKLTSKHAGIKRSREADEISLRRETKEEDTKSKVLYSI